MTPHLTHVRTRCSPHDTNAHAHARTRTRTHTYSQHTHARTSERQLLQVGEALKKAEVVNDLALACLDVEGHELGAKLERHELVC